MFTHTKTKKQAKKLVSLMLCMALVLSYTGVPVSAAGGGASSDAVYDNYAIRNILSDFQMFVQNDASGSGSAHTMGAVAIGGTADIANGIADVGIVPSYVGNVKSITLGNGYNGSDITPDRTLYYDTTETSDAIVNNARADIIQKSDYINMDEAFAQIKEESASLGTNNALIERNSSEITIVFNEGHTSVVLDASDLQGKTLKIQTPEEDGVDFFRDHPCVITVKGDCRALNFYGGITFTATNQGGNSLKEMSGSIQGSQANTDGMKLIWNLPDATSVNLSGLSGHLVAPNAEVTHVSGNYEGGIIAKSLKLDAQGHFYPYYGIGEDRMDDTEEDVTTTESSATEPSTTTQSSSTEVRYQVKKEYSGVVGDSKTEQVEKDASYKTVFFADVGKILTGIQVKIGSDLYTVDPQTGIAKDAVGNEKNGISYNKITTCLEIAQNIIKDNVKIVAMAVDKIQVVKNLENVTASGETAEPCIGKTYEVTLKPYEGKNFTELKAEIEKTNKSGKEIFTVDPATGKVTASSGAETTLVVFDKNTGKLKLKPEAVTGDILIIAKARGNNSINVTKNFNGIQESNETPVPKKESEYSIQLTPNPEKYISEITVKIGGDIYHVEPKTGTVTDSSGAPVNTINYQPGTGILTLPKEVVTGDITITANVKDSIHVTKELTGVLASDETSYPVKGETYEVTLKPESGKKYVGNIALLVGVTNYNVNPQTGEVKKEDGTRYNGITFVPATGKLTFSSEAVTANLFIKATAQPEEPPVSQTVTVTKNFDGVTSDKPNTPETLNKATPYEITFTPESEKTIEKIEVKIGEKLYKVDVVKGTVTDTDGNLTDTITYIPESGNLKLKGGAVTADIVITAVAKKNSTAQLPKPDITTQPPVTPQNTQDTGKSFTVDKKLSQTTATNETPVPEKNKDYTVTLKPKEDTKLITLTVKIGEKIYTIDPKTGTAVDKTGKRVAITYTPKTGVLFVPGTILTDSMVITAESVVTIVPILKMNKTIAKNTKFKINLVGISKNATVSYRSSNKKVATINKKGVITGKKLGKCKIYADVIQNGSYYKIRINLKVQKKIIIYSLKKAALSKKMGKLPEFNVYKRVFKKKKTKIQFTNVEKDAKVTYTSSNPKIATVKKKGHTGVVYGKKQGFTVVTAKIQQNGKTYITRVFVRVDDYKKNKKLPKYLKEIKK